MSFILRTISLFVIQLGTFYTNIKGTLGTTLGFTPAEKTETADDYAYMQWVEKKHDAIIAFSNSYTEFLHLVRYGSKNVSIISEPEFPTFDTPPAIVEAGIQKRFSAKAKKAKANPACTLDVQKLLGISPDEAALPKGDEAPDLKVTESAGYPAISFHKYHNDGINLYRDKGDGKGYGTVPYRNVFFSPFIDKDVPAEGHSAIYKYKAIYLSHDEETGKFSGEVSITIAGR